MPVSCICVVSHCECSPCEHMKQVPQETLNGTTTRSPGASSVTSLPTSSTTPIGSCPSTSPSSRNGPSTSYRCRSEPQMPLEVIRTITSVGSWIAGSGTVSTLTSRFPCQATAFIQPPSETADRFAAAGPAGGAASRRRGHHARGGGQRLQGAHRHDRGHGLEYQRRDPHRLAPGADVVLAARQPGGAAHDEEHEGHDRDRVRAGPPQRR